MKGRHIFEEIVYPWNVNCNVCFNEQITKYGLCEACFNRLEKTDGTRCNICLDIIPAEGLCSACLSERPDYVKLYCAYVFKDGIRSLILKLKDTNAAYLRYIFRDIFLDTVPVSVIKSTTLLVPVPSSKKRLNERGYNPAELICDAVSEATEIPVGRDVLSRTGDTKTALLNKADRRKSIKDQYHYSKQIFGETVMLIDDICTTGVTLRTCASQLKKAGAKEIYCFTVARTDLDGE